jgi:RimJ/RimL family protein N-acetyltransferase
VTLDVDGRLVLRAWRADDAAAVRTVFECPDFQRWHVRRLFLQHSTANPASCRVADKASFRIEGTLRHAMLHADGWHDVHLFGRLRGDLDYG